MERKVGGCWLVLVVLAGMVLVGCGSDAKGTASPASGPPDTILVDGAVRGFDSVEALLVHADLVVEGDVVGEGKGPAINTEDGTNVPRRVSVAVGTTYYSAVKDAPQTIQVTDGGWQDGARIVFHDSADMAVGQHVVLFLTQPAGADFFVQLAGPQGRYTLGKAVVATGEDPLSESLAEQAPDQLRSRLLSLGKEASGGTLRDEVALARQEAMPPVAVGPTESLGTFTAADGTAYALWASRTDRGYCYGFVAPKAASPPAIDQLVHCLTTGDLTGLARLPIASIDLSDPGFRLGVVSGDVAVVRQGTSEAAAKPIEIRIAPKALAGVRYFVIPMPAATEQVFGYDADGRPVT